MDKIQEITKMKQYVLPIISDNYNEGCGVIVALRCIIYIRFSKATTCYYVSCSNE